ncbi:CHAT domain-containing protein [Fulvivirgaceae bacterium BMA10]|uniref:CHAT domain-containing protein n=1 Tax=Splendidivirga corallicola TaxID=3051826 RepID=A0ABT8KY48_9BACT|nr:CHAT domain-containing protein [Fulvivirgaceae bacterium BMA10]
MKGIKNWLSSILVIGTISSVNCFAHNTIIYSDTLAIKYYLKAKEFGDTYRFDSSIYYYQKALSNYEEDKDVRGIILSTLGLGACYVWQSKFETAEENLKRALSISVENFGESDSLVANCYSTLGFYYGKTSDYEMQLASHKKSIDIGIKTLGANHLTVAKYYGNYGVALSNKSDYKKALNSLETQKKIYIEKLPADHKDLTHTYNNLGQVYYRKGDFDKAIDHYEKTLAINLRHSPPDYFQIGAGHLNLGTTYQAKGEFNKALDHFRMTQEAFLRIFPENHRFLGLVNNNIGVVSAKMMNYQDALLHFHSTEKIYVEQLGRDHPNMAILHINIADAYLKTNQTKKSLDHLNRALEIQLEKLPPNHPELGITLNNFGNYYLKTNKPQKALTYFQKALITLIKDFKNTDYHINPTLEHKELDSKTILLDVFKGKASAFNGLYQSDSAKTENLENSFKVYKLAIRLIDIIRFSLIREASQEDLSIRSYPIYEEAINVACKLYKITKNKEYLNAAFEFSRKSKAFTLLQAIKRADGLKFSDVPDVLIEKEHEVRVNIAFYKKQLRQAENEKDSIKIGRYKNLLFKNTSLWDSLNRHLENNYSNYYQLKYKDTFLSASEIQKQDLDAQTALLEYFVGDSSIYTFCLTHHGLEVFSQKRTKEYDLWIEGFRKSVSDGQFILNNIEKSDSLYVFSAKKLYDLLLSEPLNTISFPLENLIIVPSGTLGYLSFEALIMELPIDTKNFQYSELSYLVKNYQVRYLYTVETTNGENTVRRTSGRFGGFGVTDVSLPGADLEVEMIADITRGDTWIGPLATERNVKSNAWNYSFLHFSTHGYYNDLDPLFSNLIFTQSSDTLEDDSLMVIEVYAMRLNTHLAVLSACETGNGKLSRGEGIMSLARAFVYSGCPSIVTSLWKVDSENASYLTTYFYKNLDKGLYKDKALQDAKLSYIGQADNLHAHPHFWASFILIGDNAPVKFEDNYDYRLWLFSGILILILGYIIFRKRGNRSIERLS